MENWMTVEDCIKLFRLKNKRIKAADIHTLAWRYKIKKHHKYQGWGSTQLYYKPDVLSAYNHYNYKYAGIATYTRSTPPPENWYTLAELAQRLGCSKKRLQRLASKFAFCSHIWNGKRYADIDVVGELILWRNHYFAKKHYSSEWITERYELQKELNLKAPGHFKFCHSKPLYAPELKHL